MRVAIFDDFQKIARSLVDWSAVETRAEITVFHDHLTDQNRLVERLRDFDTVMLMRERTPFPRTVIERLPKLKRRLPRSIITPHLGYATAGNYREYYGKTVENIARPADPDPQSHTSASDATRDRRLRPSRSDPEHRQPYSSVAAAGFSSPG